MPLSIVIIKNIQLRGAFRTPLNICDGAFVRKQLTDSSRSEKAVCSKISVWQTPLRFM